MWAPTWRVSNATRAHAWRSTLVLHQLAQMARGLEQVEPFCGANYRKSIPDHDQQSADGTLPERALVALLDLGFFDYTP